MNDFFRFRCEAGDEPTSAELLIFAPIGDWEDFGEVSAQAFAKELAKLPTSVKRLDIHINSPGGSVFEASGIYSRLADHRATKNVYIDGLAASAASIIAMVGHKIYIRANANMMIHAPSGIAIGNAEDMRKMIAALDSITESMINVYEKRTGQERDQLRTWMNGEFWMNPEQAVEHGFADEVRGVVKAAAQVTPTRAIFNGTEFDLSRFRNIPAFTASTPTEGKTMPTATKPKEESAAADPKEEKPTPPKDGEKDEKKPPTTEEQTIPKKPAKGTEELAGSATDAVSAERARVAALMELDRPATHDVIMAAIKDGRQVADVVKDVMAAMDKKSTADARRSDARVLDHIPPSEASDGNDEFGALLTRKVQGVLKSRGQKSGVLHSRN